MQLSKNLVFGEYAKTEEFLQKIVNTPTELQ